MKLLEQIVKRRAYRAFSPEPIDRQIQDTLLEAAVLAPSCANKQPWRFLVLNDAAALDKARKALTPGNYWAQKAPVLILALTKRDLDCALNDGRDYALFDTGMAVMNLQLQAVAEGLHVHPMAGFDPLMLKEEFGIGEEWTLITVIAVAKPGPDETLSDKHKEMEVSARDRKPVAEIASYNEWRET